MNLSRYSPLMLRLSLAIVFLWFGVDKFVSPGYWVHQVPETLRAIAGITDASEYAFVHSIGVFEILVGSALTLGIFTRHVAAIASAFVISIIATTGLNPATVRDIGLLGISLYLLSTSDATARWKYRLKSGKGLLALLIVLITAVATPLAMGINGSAPSKLEEIGVKAEPGLVFLEPAQDEILQVKSIEVKLKITVDLRKLGVSHIHFRLDGQVVDTVYARDNTKVIPLVLNGLSPGRHTLSAYLAFIDHTELPKYKTSVTFIVQP